MPYNAGIHENVARTLEYAYDDWCIAQVAKQLGHGEDAAMLEKASHNWRNVFDAETKLMRGRNRSGDFQRPFSPYKWGDAFTEGNAWHYTWSVFHDVEGLADAMGGKEEFGKMLDSVFVVPPIYDDSYYGVRIHEITEMQVANMGNYAHGNQPAQHMIYLYDYAGQPAKAQWWTREVMDRLYSAKPDGYCGDEDNGQTSAWYVFSALGFYPVCPASDCYAVGAPLSAARRCIWRTAGGSRSRRRRTAPRIATSGRCASTASRGTPISCAGRTLPGGPRSASTCRPSPTCRRGTDAQASPARCGGGECR